MLRAIACGALAWALPLAAMACPTDIEPRSTGVLLIVQGAGAGTVTLLVEAAADGYRAVFSWGELFNANGGEQTLVVVAQDGRPLDAFAGPLALRALADIRPRPRHVRNLCALLVRR